MIKNHVNINDKKRRFVVIATVAVTVMLVASITTIGAAPISLQQQGTERTPGPSITSGNIVDGEVQNQDLADDAVTSDKIADGEVTSADIEDGEVGSADVADGSIGSADLAPDAIPSPTSGGTPDDNTVTSAKIVDGAVASADIGDGQITTQDLANGAVTRDKIASDAIQLTTHAVFRTHDMGPRDTTRVHAVCPEGEIVTGGGFSYQHSLVVLGSYQDGDRVWTIAAHNPTEFTIPVTATATCAVLTP